MLGLDDSFERVVVPVSGQADDEHALSVALRLAPKQAFSLTLLYVVEVAQSIPLDAELPLDLAAGETALTRAEAIARGVGGKALAVTTELLQSRSRGAAIVDEAVARGADAIVMTATVQRKHGRPTLGETVHYVMMHALCQVIVVRLPTVRDAIWDPGWR